MSNPAEKLCLSCGLCCNGVIFADVRVQATDNAERLRVLNLLKRVGANKVSQPCAMHDGCRCAIYSDRPKHCRDFDCLLLKDAAAGQVTEAQALRIIKDARKKAARVKELLEQLGDKDASVALSKRFKAMCKRVENGHRTRRDVEIFGLLTLAMHELNIVLSERFYR